jgi:two-component system chemotaxis response regulator CheY
MTTLIVEDDFTNRLVLQKRLEEHGEVELAVNGVEAIDAVTNRLKEGKIYDLICLDIMLPEMDGQEALKRIRAAENAAGFAVGQGSKIVMTTALSDANNVMSAFRGEADGYLVKPIERDKLEQQLTALGLLCKKP